MPKKGKTSFCRCLTIEMPRKEVGIASVVPILKKTDHNGISSISIPHHCGIAKVVIFFKEF